MDPGYPTSTSGWSTRLEFFLWSRELWVTVVILRYWSAMSSFNRFVFPVLPVVTRTAYSSRCSPGEVMRLVRFVLQSIRTWRLSLEAACLSRLWREDPRPIISTTVLNFKNGWRQPTSGSLSTVWILSVTSCGENRSCWSLISTPWWIWLLEPGASVTATHRNVPWLATDGRGVVGASITPPDPTVTNVFLSTTMHRGAGRRKPMHTNVEVTINFRKKMSTCWVLVHNCKIYYFQLAIATGFPIGATSTGNFTSKPDMVVIALIAPDFATVQTARDAKRIIISKMADTV